MIPVHIRWMIRRDMPEVLAIEQTSWESPWGEDKFLRHLRQRNVIGYVAEQDRQIVGFMIYELRETTIHVLNLTVNPQFRRQRIGHQLVNKLILQLHRHRRKEVIIDLIDSNICAHMFLSKCGFMAVPVEEDIYRFTFTLPDTAALVMDVNTLTLDTRRVRDH